MSTATSLAALTFLVATASAPAFAAPDGGVVEGNVVISEKVGSPPVRSEGFVKRMPNPIMKTRSYDPRPEMVVVLVGGDVAPDDTSPPSDPARFELIGESFERRVFPVLAGRELEIKNVGRNAPLLSTPGAPDLMAAEAINPGGVRSLTVSEPHAPVVIRARGSVHLEATVVAFPHPYFAAVDGKGEFRIEGVPPGRWTVRVWFRDGWLDMKKETVDVAARRTAKVKNLNIPPALKIESGD